MSSQFIQKITEGIQGQAYRVDLNDNVVIFCRDGFRCEGTLVGYCPEGIVIQCGGAIVWLKAEWVGGVAKVRHKGGSSDGREECVPPTTSVKKAIPEDSGHEAMNKVFCNGRITM